MEVIKDKNIHINRHVGIGVFKISDIFPIFDYLTVEWITPEEHQRLAKRLNVTFSPVKHPEKPD